MQPQVLQLKEKNPDVLIFISYTSDAILYTKTMKELDWKPGDPDRRQCGLQRSGVRQDHRRRPVEGLISRSAFAPGKPGSVADLFNKLYKKKTGGDGLDDVSVRGLQGFMVLADAINRAGSTEPAKIQAALKATDLPAEQMVAGYDGVKFDDKGQNTLGFQRRDPDARRQVRRRLAQGAGHRRGRSCPTRAGSLHRVEQGSLGIELARSDVA